MLNYDDLIARAEYARVCEEEREKQRAAGYPRCFWCGEPTPATFGNGRTPICAACYAIVSADPRVVRRLHRGE